MPRTGILSGSRRGSTVAGLLDDALGVFAARELAAELLRVWSQSPGWSQSLFE